MTYEIKYNYNNQDVKDGKFSLESARHFAKKAATQRSYDDEPQSE